MISDLEGTKPRNCSLACDTAISYSGMTKFDPVLKLMTRLPHLLQGYETNGSPTPAVHRPRNPGGTA